jgi:hypothetical protein
VVAAESPFYSCSALRSCLPPPIVGHIARSGRSMLAARIYRRIHMFGVTNLAELDFEWTASVPTHRVPLE